MTSATEGWELQEIPRQAGQAGQGRAGPGRQGRAVQAGPVPPPQPGAGQVGGHRGQLQPQASGTSLGTGTAEAGTGHLPASGVEDQAR